MEGNKKSQEKRILHPNSFYHIYNRGNHKKEIFHSHQDYQVFLNLLSKYLNIYDQIHLYSYCLMPNHYHLLLRTGSNPEDVINFMHRFMTSYAIYFNKSYGLTGRLFQSRYKSKHLLGENAVKKTFEYIAQNPVKGQLCRRSKDYKWAWSSELLFSFFEKKFIKEKMQESTF